MLFLFVNLLFQTEQKRKLRGVSNIGTFYYDDSANKKNGEFDVVLERKNAYDIYEAKYYSVPIRLKEMQEEERQVRASKACWSE